MTDQPFDRRESSASMQQYARDRGVLGSRPLDTITVRMESLRGPIPMLPEPALLYADSYAQELLDNKPPMTAENLASTYIEVVCKDQFCIMRDAYFKRAEYIKNYGFTIPCSEWVEALVALSPLLEIGAGNGFLARVLYNNGADIIATDDFSGDYGMTLGQHYDIQKMDASRAVRHWPKRNVLCSWPSYGGSWAYDAYKTMRFSNTFAYIGEPWGCTGDDSLSSLCDHGEYIDGARFIGINDALCLISGGKNATN